MISFPGFRSESEVKDLDPDPITDTHMKGCICIYKTDTSSLIFQKTFYCCVPHQRTNILEKLQRVLRTFSLPIALLTR